MWEVPAGDVSVTDAQDASADNGLEGLTIQTLTADDEVRLRVEAAPTDDPEKVQGVTQELAELTGSDIEDVSLNAVGPSWGEEISRKALRALVVFLVLITIYITLRFELRMAIPTLVALIHDVLITIGVYSIAGFEVTPATVIAVLTILGFSIYDGIVVFDKVDENTKLVGTTHGLTYSDMVDLSLNQVLMRSLNTSITALLPVASLLILGSYILGATTLQEFALGAAHRPVRRRLLVALHRLAAPGRAQGAGAEVPRHPPSARGQGAPRRAGDRRRVDARTATRRRLRRPLVARRCRGGRSRRGRGRRARSGSGMVPSRSLVRW